MSGIPPGGPQADGRISTGNPELDKILNGGLVARRPYLLVGPSGTGKTTLALQFLCEGVRRGEKVLMVTLEEPPNEMRVNHRGLAPELDQVFVFDAIPDVMRYERTPFKDIAAVRESVPFHRVPLEIRRTPELSSVEVTFTALEQTLKMEIVRRNYTRLVIDSLTALQYFCMKGVDETVGAQTFLRFLSDLRVTTLLTVEAPLEDIETPERLLARGEVRLFRWELEGKTVRAVGVEKFRGSEHDLRLHPYRISAKGLDINLGLTISRDTRQVMEESAPPIITPSHGPLTPTLDHLALVEEEIQDLVAVGVSLEEVRDALVGAVRAVEGQRQDEARQLYTRARGLIVDRLVGFQARAAEGSALRGPAAESAARRLVARAAEARTGIPPVQLGELTLSAPALRHILQGIPLPGAAAPAATAIPSSAVPKSPVPAPPVPTISSVAAPPPTSSAPAPRPPTARGTRVGQSPPAPPPMLPRSGAAKPAGDRRSSGSPATPERPSLPDPSRIPPIEPPAAPPAASVPEVVPVAPPAPVVKKRRRPVSKKKSAAAGAALGPPEPAVAATSEGAESAAPAVKPKRRIVRKKKAAAPVARPATDPVGPPSPPEPEPPIPDPPSGPSASGGS